MFKHLKAKIFSSSSFRLTIYASMGKIDDISHIPDVDLAEAGCCKYLLIEVQDHGKTYSQSKFIVHGDAYCVDHGKKYAFKMFSSCKMYLSVYVRIYPFFYS